MNVVRVIKLVGAWGFLGAAVVFLLLVGPNAAYVMPCALTSVAFSLVPEN